MHKLQKKNIALEKRWRKLLEQQKHSGLSQQKFCDSQGVNARTFSCWKTRLAKRDREKKFVEDHKKQGQFVPMIVAGEENRQSDTESDKVAEFNLNGISITVFRGADLYTLRLLLRACKENFY